VAGVFLLAEWVALTGFGTFTSLLGILSALVLPLLGGIFPALLLAATRRKGDFVPGVVYRLLGNSLVLTALYLFFLIVILVHGLFIWETVVTRLIAVLVGGGVLGGTIMMLKRGALSSRMVVELRDDQRLNGQPGFNVTGSGQAVVAEVQLKYKRDQEHLRAASGDIPDFKNLRAISFDLPPTPATELKLWLHRLTPDDFSESMPGRVTVQQGQEKRQVAVASAAGQVVLPLNHGNCQVEITLVEESAPELSVNL
jgi:hypothetical protein